MTLRSTIITCLVVAAFFHTSTGRAEIFQFPPLSQAGNAGLAEIIAPDTPKVIIYGSADIEAFQPAIDGFRHHAPQVAVEYHQLQTLEMYDRVLAESGDGELAADLVISSSMDLQMKLANDGYARPHDSNEIAALPKWASWRNEAFAITQEPAVIVYNRRFFRDHNLTPPTTRNALLNMLSQQADLFEERIITYDVERSGVGFLFLARDERHYDPIWDLIREFGKVRVKLFSNTSPMLEKIAEGQVVLGYNLLGSYAETFSHRNPNVGVILPDDYIVVYSRIAIIPRSARNPDLGGQFLDYILSVEGQEILQNDGNFSPVRSDVPSGPNMTIQLDRHGERVRSFPVGPGLLVYLDQAKRERFITRWQDSLMGRR
ncbi:ABC transporter substrate-binding protein [Thalassospira sp.]|uniref:ABC transporter substrate-binding protein n=1 Tax=Thalassospira sp. TaxID=1912094 RepID=UPI002736FDA8|nr:ABC transporter substrate-binding protein [Thalassospira sp.]MDP2698438.1 ABC transporter substrate-binding protein [Thalassospira sp.]